MKELLRILSFALVMTILLSIAPLAFATDTTEPVETTEPEQTTEPTPEETTEPEVEKKTITVELKIFGKNVSEGTIWYVFNGQGKTLKTSTQGFVTIEDAAPGTHSFYYMDKNGEKAEVNITEDSLRETKALIDIKSVSFPVRALPVGATITDKVQWTSVFRSSSFNLDENNEYTFVATVADTYSFSLLGETKKVTVRPDGTLSGSAVFLFKSMDVNTQLNGKDADMVIDVFKLDKEGKIIPGASGKIVDGKPTVDGSLSITTNHEGKALLRVRKGSLPYKAFDNFKGEKIIEFDHLKQIQEPVVFNLPLYQFIAYEEDGSPTTSGFITLTHGLSKPEPAFADKNGFMSRIGDPLVSVRAITAYYKFEAYYRPDAEGKLDVAMPVILREPDWNKLPSRIEGKNRYFTALEIARETVKIKSTDTMILATGEDFSDALVANSLAGIYDAPILLTEKDVLDPAVKTFLSENDSIKNIIIIGGNLAISDTVEAELSDYEVNRISGPTRYDTAVEVFKIVLEKNPSAVDETLFVNATRYPDAISVGPLAAKNGNPILLVRHKEIPASVAALLEDQKMDKAIAIGGESVISKEVLESLGAMRVAGSTRSLTSIAVAKRYFPEAEFAFVARENHYADALVTGRLAALKDAPILLVDGEEGSDFVNSHIEAQEYNDLVIVGGSTAITPAVEEELFSFTK